MPRRNKIVLFIAIGIYALYLLGYKNYWNLSLILWLACFYNLIEGYGKRIVFKELLILLAVTKMFFAPAYFHSLRMENVYRVITFAHLPEEDYFEFALPATIFFVIGLLIPLSKKEHSFEDKSFIKTFYGISKYRKQGFALLLIGVFSDFLSKIFPFPGEIGFVLYVFSSLKFVGAVYLLLYGEKNISLLYMGYTIFFGFISGMAGAFIWPMVIYGMYFCLPSRKTYLFQQK